MDVTAIAPDVATLDPAQGRAARRQRFEHFQTIDVPRLRVVGFTLNAIGVILHNYLTGRPVSLADALFITTVLVGYAVFSWGVIALFWARVKFVDIGDVFLVVDVFFLAFVVYSSGANNSLLYLVFLARPADQVATTFRRSLFFAHVGPLAYLGLILFVSSVQHRDVAWNIEWAKIIFLYMMSIYIALTARTAEDRRNKLAMARRTAEQAVRSADERRRALEHAMVRLESANKSKSEFLANVSHELRTPLNSVLGSADLLLDTPLTRDQREMIGVLRDSADSLTHIVNDILDLARVEARRMPIEHIPIRLRDVVSATLRMFTARTRHRPIELVCLVDHDVPDMLTGDPVRLRQVLTNLLGNAVKFTEIGEVILHVSRGESQEGRVALQFAVSDTGIGIAADQQAAIFQAFTQADGSNTRKYGGTGLGLTIAAELVGLMDGRIWVESEPGKGSTFSFVAWFGHLPEQPRESLWGPGPIAAIVVGNQSAARTAVEEALAFWPIDIRTAAGAHAALAESDGLVERGGHFDIALIDSDVTGFSALELAARLRGRPHSVSRVVLLLKTSDAPIDAERAASLGALYLVKPVTPQMIGELLRGAFGKAQPAATLPMRQPPARPLRVLVADDHEVNQAVVGAMLRKWGHAVATAFDGQEALDRIAVEQYDVVLMDIQMPVMDGLDATRRLRQREGAGGLDRLPVIAMTARAMDEDRERCLAAGMDAYVAKPIQQQVLFDALSKYSTIKVDASSAPIVTTASEAGAAAAAAFEITPIVSDPTLVRHIAELFLKTLPEQMTRLSRALESGEAGQAKALAHSIRGAAAYFAGADTSAAADIEQWCRDGNVERAHARFAQLRTDMDALVERLTIFLSA